MALSKSIQSAQNGHVDTYWRVIPALLLLACSAAPAASREEADAALAMFPVLNHALAMPEQTRFVVRRLGVQFPSSAIT